MMTNALAIIGGFASIAGVIIAIVQAYRLWKWYRQPTWDQALRVAEGVLQKIESDEWRPELVIGIGRSGGIWGGYLAGNLGSLPFVVIDCEMSEENGLKRTHRFPGGHDFASAIHKCLPNNKKILLVEGAVSTGGTFEAFFDELGPDFKGCEIRTATLYRNPAAAFQVDYVGRVDLEPWPRKFPWHLRDAYRPFLRDALTARS